MTEGRRHDDDPLYQRLTRLELQVGALETKVNSLTLEHKHMADLFGARFTTMERAQDLAIVELRAMNKQISDMASEADKSPAGRVLLKAIEDIRKNEAQQKSDVCEIQEWQDNIKGVLLVLKWMGASGVVALLWVALRSMGAVP